MTSFELVKNPLGRKSGLKDSIFRGVPSISLSMNSRGNKSALRNILIFSYCIYCVGCCLVHLQSASGNYIMQQRLPLVLLDTDLFLSLTVRGNNGECSSY